MRAPALLAAAILAGCSYEAAAQTPRWVVRDVDGAFVGPVLMPTADPALARAFSDESPLWVARRIPGHWIQLLVTRKALWATRDRVPFLYEDYNCAGPAFLEAPPSTNAARAAVVFDTEVFWPKGPAESRVMRAKGVLVGNPDQCAATLVEPDLCCTVLDAEETRLVAEASHATVASLHLRPPFRLQRGDGESR